MSQSINNFSDNDISQTHDWKCPSLSPHVLLLGDIAQNIAETGVFCSFSEGSLGRVLQELAFNLILHGGAEGWITPLLTLVLNSVLGIQAIVLMLGDFP